MSNMDPKALRTRVENISNIPTIPSVLKQLSTIIENPKISLNEISHFVSKDPALTTKILQMVNSALYGFPGRISSVNHAVMLLGLNVVKGLLSERIRLRDHAQGHDRPAGAFHRSGHRLEGPRPEKGPQGARGGLRGGAPARRGQGHPDSHLPGGLRQDGQRGRDGGDFHLRCRAQPLLRNPCRRGGMAVGKMALPQ